MGELHSKAVYDYPTLEQVPIAVEMIAAFSSSLYRSPDNFEQDLDRPGIHCRWCATAPTAGIATLRCHQRLASLSFLATGLSADADAHTLEAFQRFLLRHLHDTGVEPAFALTNLTERPLLATVNFASPEAKEDQLFIAFADRCFAAAYFRWHRLV